MNYAKADFVQFIIDCGVLQFGDFQLKSGRQSPYFFNAGLFYEGNSLQRLGQFYAQCLINASVDCQQLFGPAYKGLPLATATAIALANHGINTSVTFNRKETKDHGEGGLLIGAPLKGPIIMIDDVITAGTAFRESKAIIEANGGRLSTVVIAFDRCEHGSGTVSTLEEISKEGIQVLSIINFFDLIAYLRESGESARLNNLLQYHSQFD